MFRQILHGFFLRILLRIFLNHDRTLIPLIVYLIPRFVENKKENWPLGSLHRAKEGSLFAGRCN